jgi:hypothetical protein
MLCFLFYVAVSHGYYDGFGKERIWIRLLRKWMVSFYVILLDSLAI